MRIVVDTREQKPYQFETPSQVGTLKCGDYSIYGLEDYVSIERKELNDLISCLTTGRDRFEKVLHKGRALDYFALVVEASLSDLVSGRFRSQASPKSMVQSLVAFSVKYRLPIFFAESREYGQRLTASLLEKYSKEVQRRYEALSKAVDD